MSEQASKNTNRDNTQAAPMDEVPHSPEAEQSLLGAIMLDGAVMDRVANIVEADDFYIDAHRTIYRACMQLTMQGHPVDQVTVYERIEAEGRASRVGSFSYVASLAGQTPSAANAHKYAEIIREKSVRRKAIAIAHDMIASASARDGRSAVEVIQHSESKMIELSDMTDKGKQDFKEAGEVLVGVIERMDHLYNNPPENGIVGTATGFLDFDKLISGLQPGLYILAGRPAMGKTALAMNIAENIATDEDLPVVIFSMEMPADQLMQRMLGSAGKIDQSRMRNVTFTDEDWTQVTYAVGKLNNAQIYIDDTPGLTTLDIRTRVRKLSKKVGKIGIIVVDYLQLLSSNNSNRNANRAEVVGEFSRSLKLLSGEMKVPVLALSQLNRSLEQRPNKRPGMADLRESGSLEQDADLVMFVYRDEVYDPDSPDKGTAELIVGKNRHGPLAIIRLAFRGQYTLFENMAQYSNSNGYAE